jgi:hypothetical protein
MAYERYILMAYPLIVGYENEDITVIRVSEVNLSRLIGLLSKNELIYSKPQRDLYSTKYVVHVLGDVDAVSDKLEELKVEYETKRKSEIPNVEHLINCAGYITLRGYLYKHGYRRGASSKLYDPSKIVYNSKQILNVYKALTTNIAKMENATYLFIDASRKLEFTKSIQELELTGVISENVPIVSWLKIIETPISFYVEDNISVNNLVKKGYGEKLLEHSQSLIEYLVDTGRLDWTFRSLDFGVEDLFEYALVPRSIKLKRELHEQGHLFRDLEKSVEVLFLPKSILTPVASPDNIKRILPEELESITENLRISPAKRYEEVQNFVDTLVSNGELCVRELHITLEREPREVPSVGKAKLSYIEPRGGEKSSPQPIQWDYIDKIKRHGKQIRILVISIGKLSDLVKKQLGELKNHEVEVEFREFPDRSSLEEAFLDTINELKNCEKPYKGLFVIGPLHIDKKEDEEIKRNIEYKVALQGIFCRYLSRVDGEERLPYKIRTVLRSFAIFVLGELSHILKPLEIWDKDRKKHSINVVVGVDATVIGMEKGSYRVACAVTMVNLMNGTFEIKPYIDISDEGEDAVIAKVLDSLINQRDSRDSTILIYVNRARPEASILNYLKPESVELMLHRSIIVGVTRTHNYSRVLKFTSRGRRRNIIVNPEPWIYIPLYKNVEDGQSHVKFKVSRYMMSTVKPPKRLEFELTIRPILLTILQGERYIDSPQLEEKIIDYTASLAALNNVSTAWTQSLPWPLHTVDRKLKRAHELISERRKNKILQLIQKEDVFRVL